MVFARASWQQHCSALRDLPEYVLFPRPRPTGFPLLIYTTMRPKAHALALLLAVGVAVGPLVGGAFRPLVRLVAPRMLHFEYYDTMHLLAARFVVVRECFPLDPPRISQHKRTPAALLSSCSFQAAPLRAVQADREISEPQHSGGGRRAATVGRAEEAALWAGTEQSATQGTPRNVEEQLAALERHEAGSEATAGVDVSKSPLADSVPEPRSKALSHPEAHHTTTQVCAALQFMHFAVWL